MGAGALAASVLACGSNDGGGSSGGAADDRSGLLFKPTDVSKGATKGGRVAYFLNNNPTHFDPLSGSNQFIFGPAGHCYQQLVKLQHGTYDTPATNEPVPDAVEKWEISGDKLQITMKLRPDNKLDARAPTNSRVLNSEDVKWSWERFKELQPGRGFFDHSAHPDAPIDSVSYPDRETIVWKLAAPSSALMKMFGTSYYLKILPVEAEDKFDFKQDMRGSGAWLMTKYEPSVSISYERNPNWYGAKEGRPYLDGLDYYIIKESAAQLAQFEAKRLDWFTPNADLAIPLRRRHSEMLLIADSPFRGQGGANQIGMSKQPNSPWEQDLRMRQALSMLIDRDAYLEVIFALSNFEREGLPVEVGWHSHVPCSWPLIWLDPKTNKLGENSKYFHHNPDEAAKLLRAAGRFGHEDTITFAATGQFANEKEVSVLAQMWNEGGHFKIKLNPQDYTTVITPKYTFGSGDYPDIGVHPFGSWADWDVAMWNTWSPGGRNDIAGHHTPELQELMIQHRQEFDEKKRTSIVHEWQKRMAYHMITIPKVGQATTYRTSWPWLEGYAWYEAAGGGTSYQETYPLWWSNKSKDTRSA
jgi:ABC-type transport system substrate-binding protein